MRWGFSPPARTPPLPRCLRNITSASYFIQGRLSPGCGGIVGVSPRSAVTDPVDGLIVWSLDLDRLSLALRLNSER